MVCLDILLANLRDVYNTVWGTRHILMIHGLRCLGLGLEQYPATQPRWRHVQLRCSEREAKRREATVMTWLSHIGSVPCHSVHAFHELLPGLQDGTVLALAVRKISSRPVPGVLDKPCTMETRHTNISKCVQDVQTNSRRINLANMLLLD